ncbi:MAG: hypothetical protein A2W93_08695 [Bacteroidetes bacterium GWF2_43_63]|nr:MAG: hypothetical protein A2W94_03100 [Bacteroidetes bacterium GWE2_42_42]OFY55209.1 MAG: hypothetical protein A2W93_08695 [Bacteroidetes bacterium GWF2_43_63]
MSIFAVSAQTGVVTSGGNASGSGGSVSYSIGQVVYTTNPGTDGSVAQGVQQPYEISEVVAISDYALEWECSVFPNPANDFLIISQTHVDDCIFQLFDYNGQLVRQGKLNVGETNVPMRDLAPAMYFLRISNAAGELEKEFKIVKNQ